MEAIYNISSIACLIFGGTIVFASWRKGAGFMLMVVGAVGLIKNYLGILKPLG